MSLQTNDNNMVSVSVYVTSDDNNNLFGPANPTQSTWVAFSKRAEVEAATSRGGQSDNVTFHTDAMVLSQLRKDPSLSDVDVIVVRSCGGKEKLVERLARAVELRKGRLRVAVLEATQASAAQVCKAFSQFVPAIVQTDSEDPLDAAGARGEYSEARRAWAALWRRFPLYSNKATLNAIEQSFRESRVTVVISGTGSGKTVIAPPLMLHALGGEGSVAVTIPKRATVLAAAKTACLTLDAGELGGLVGYSFRGEEKTSDATRLLYTTDGMLLAKTRERGLGAFDAVIVDEAHERPVATDFLLQALRSHARARPAFRIVIMSATIDPALFVSYFGTSDVRVVSVAGQQMHPIRRLFDAAKSSNYVASGVETVRRVFRPAEGGNVLFFVPLVGDTAKACQLLKLGKACVRLYGKMTQDERDDALGQRTAPTVFVATNVAESSLTFPALSDVVDSGLQLSSRWHAGLRCQIIAVEMASRAQLTQRMGRVGRTAPGVAHLLYTKKAWDALPEFPPPAILTVDLTDHVLSELAAAEKKKGDVGDAFARGSPEWFATELITPPVPEQIRDAFRYLRFYGLIREDEGRHRISIFGGYVMRTSVRLKLAVPNALLVVLGVVHGVAEEAARLAVVLELCRGELEALDPGPGRVQGGKSFAHQRILDTFSAATDRDRVEKLGISLDTWKAVHEAWGSRGLRTEIAKLSDESARIRKMCGRVFRPRREEGEGSLQAAVVAARMYNLIRCDWKKKSAVALFALEKSVGALTEPRVSASEEYGVFESHVRASATRTGVFRFIIPIENVSPNMLSDLIRGDQRK
jgi:HrpA-like RNA helicase